jgi:hypothetical protein
MNSVKLERMELTRMNKPMILKCYIDIPKVPLCIQLTWWISEAAAPNGYNLSHLKEM